MKLLEMLFGKPIPEIAPHELNEKLKDKKNFTLIDVRQPEEFKAGHIPGAKLIPLGELNRRLDEIPKNKEIAFICATGNRSSTAARMLARQGYTVFNVRGGMYLWSRALFKRK
ncbi:MAG: rhodanese-like domain-containing protein [Chloroflexi bacterium]|nr:rhodanese-like domain-containing protein [Chloroflexota bacterium]